MRCIPAVKLGINFVPPHAFAGAVFNDLVVIQTKRQQYSFFQPLIDMPGAVGLFFGNTQRAFIQQIKRKGHRITHLPFGIGANFSPVFPGIIDQRGKGRMLHDDDLS